MRMTVGEIRNELKSWIPGSPDLLYENAINRAYSDLARSHPWAVFNTEFKFATVQSIDYGGAHFTNGSVDVTAAQTVLDETAWETGDANGFAGLFIKKINQAAYYTIQCSLTTKVSLTESYIGTTTTAVASSGESYVIFKHIYNIPSAVETVLHLMHENDYLEEMDVRTFEDIDPHLNETGIPRKWVFSGVNSSNVTQVQLYPARIDGVYEIRGRGQLRPEVLCAASTPLLDSSLLLSFAEVELLKRKRIISPTSISEEMLVNAINNAGRKLEEAMRYDIRLRTDAKYIHDNFFKSYHRGQKWLVSHDPWYFR